MVHSKFVHLHVHTDYSLLDGACKISKLAELASRYKLPALAITDHGNMFGAIEFYEKMQKSGIKPIIGEEAYIAPGSRKERKSIHGITSFHLVLLARNERGYKNLIKLSTIGFTEGFYYKPRIDKEILKEMSEGLIALSGCIKGEIPYYILKDNYKKAEKVAREYLSIFGEDNFYLELMRLGLKENSIVNRGLLALSEDLGIPVVATNDCHYLKREDAEAHDILLCLQTGKNINDDKRLKFSSNELYFKSPEEMEALFSDYPEAILNTVKIAEKCNLELNLDPTRVWLPHYPLPEGYKTSDEYLMNLAEDGLKKRFKEVTPEIERRFRYELETITKVGFSSYFLIIKDIIDEAKRRKIPVGPGRGSACGSLVLYCLGITETDPIKLGLIFERFLNPERVSMPDVDIDFSDERRDEVIDYIINKYGKKNVCQIITFGTMAARAAIRDVGRVSRVPLPEVDRIAKLIPFGSTIDEALRDDEFKNLISSRDEYKKLIEIARTLEGITRHASVHAAGVVIAPKQLTEFAPLYKMPDGTIVTQYSMHALEDIGLLKIDILGLRTLTVIHNTIDTLKNKGVAIDLYSIPMDDKKTFSLLRKGDTGGVFQLESDGMKDLLRKLAPESFSDIMAVLALYRPGPLGGFNKDKLIKRRHKEELIEYLHPNLEPILKETYGIILYQEQVMQLANVVAGFSLGEADILRRAMGKKMLDVMDEKRKSFIDGAISRGYSEKLANKLFDLITPFAGYGFAKSHSAGYALISYETAYLKAHYPVEFMASTLTSEMDNSDKVGHFVGESKKMHIPILPPDINRSKYQFIAQDGKIRFGLGAIKNVGKKAILSMVETREKGGNFKDLPDFLMRVGSRDMNKRAMESLVKAGAFDTIDKNRKRILSILSTDKKKEMERRQMALFGAPKIEREEEKEWTLGEVLSNEKEALGFYFSGHPLERFRDEIETFGTVSTNQIQGYSPGTEVVLGGIVAKKRRKINKNGKPMVFLDFEDFEGTCEVAIFGNLAEKDWREEQPLLIKGRVSQFNDKKSIRASKTINLREVKEKLVNRVDIYINTIGLEDETLHSLKDILLSTPGDKDVLLHLIQERRVTVLRCKNLKISPKRSVIIRIRKLLGEKSVKLGGERF